MHAQPNSSTLIAKTLPLLFMFMIAAQALCTSLAQDNPKKSRALLPEGVARESAITVIMPIYPEEALKRGISGTVHIKLEVSAEGEVLRIKVKPRTQPLFKHAVAEAVKQWRFKTWKGAGDLPAPFISRLIFEFSVTDSEANVELYTPKPDNRTDECLGCSNDARELREWKEWEEIWSSDETKGGD